ncbi:alpha/beta hydrolase [Pseudonocardia sp. TRM90224]|uniref:alpha/beta hydrolase n=1 Tax=Pseudonocardia sp. TRM90224 TaxID=2812678 RepID=UPI001E42551B|nr:alpha/beta hydrolase [Pseudonocardia sp. TRM90224]
MHVSRSVLRLASRGVIAPLLNPSYPVTVRRRVLDATGYTVLAPRGTRRSRGALGGVPTERVAAREAAGPHQVLYLHGGGYQVGSPTSHRGLAAHLSLAASAPVHVPDYRLAPEHPYPAAVDDVERCFLALREAGHPAQRIAVVGDSAGGGLAMALVLRLRAAGADLPGSIGLISPWLDLDLRFPELWTNADSDAMLDPRWLAEAVRAYCGAERCAELTPLDADLSGLPPIHTFVGTDEILLGDTNALVAAVEKAGGSITCRRDPGMWHDHLVFAGMLQEADDAMAELGGALRADCAA